MTNSDRYIVIRDGEFPKHAMKESAKRDEERRSTPRTRMLRRGLIIYNNGWSTRDCSIQDLSEGGARLRMSDIASYCPEEFKLRSEATGQARLCQVVWMKGHELGVRWTSDIGDV